MSSGQWAALPQRTRRRRHTATSAPGDNPLHPPRQHQHDGETTTAHPALAPADTARCDQKLPHNQQQEREENPHQKQNRGQSLQQPLDIGSISSSPPLCPFRGHATAKADAAGRVHAPHDGAEAPQRVIGDVAGPPICGTNTSSTREAAGSATASVDRKAHEGGAEAAPAAVVCETEKKTKHVLGKRGEGNVGAPDPATVASRNAAVETAVEARSKMTRFSEGLEGGAGADGGAEGANFEYLDHTADVQLHSWGDCIERAIEGAVAAMFNTITDISKIEPDPILAREIEIEGHDAKSLLFNLLDEFLFLFHSEALAIKTTTVHGSIIRGSDGEAGPRWKLRATAEGETFNLTKHPQGTEVKAITYSNMQINETPDGRTDIYVIVDI